MNEPDDHNTSTGLIERELSEVDRALETGAVEAEAVGERELQELALALRADVAEPRDEFAAELGSRARDGFPRPRRFPRLPRITARRALPLLAGAATLIVVAVVALPGSDDDRDLDGVTDRAGRSATPEAAEQLEAPSTAIAPVPPPTGGGFVPGERERKIERLASLTLAAPGDKLDRVGDGIVTVTDRHHGFVLRSSLTTGDDGTTGGSFELRIPGSRLQQALRDLSGLADVRARTQSGEDVTRAFVSVEDRLETARAERRSLLRRLERADTDTAAESIRRRLDANAAEIRGLRGQLRDLRTRTNYAAVSITLAEKDGEERSGASDENSTGQALDDALGSLVGALNLLLRVLGVALPLALVGGALWLGGRSLLRRRREAALS